MWCVNNISICEMKSLLTLFHTWETVTQDAKGCSTLWVPSVKVTGRHFDNTQNSAVWPVDFACIAEGCSLVYSFASKSPVFTPSHLWLFMRLLVKVPWGFTSLYPLPYSDGLSQDFSFQCYFPVQLAQRQLPIFPSIKHCFSYHVAFTGTSLFSVP